jgi:hypothetical protein
VKRREGPEGVPQNSPCVQVPQRGEGRHSGHHCRRTLGYHPTAPKKPSGTLKQRAKFTSSVTLPAVSKEADARRTPPGAPGDVSGPLSVEPIGTTSSTAQVDKVVPNGERRNKTPVHVPGVINAQIPGADSREVQEQTRSPDER